MQNKTSDKINSLDTQQQQLIDSLKADSKAMLAYVSKMVERIKPEKLLATGR